MLVLTRKVDQGIRLGNDIVITVLRVRGNQVRLGITAPRDVRVVRDELPPLEPAAAAAPQVEIVSDLEFTTEFEIADGEIEQLAAQVDLAQREAATAAGFASETLSSGKSDAASAPSVRRAPLAGFFPRTVELAVANLSV